MKWDTHISYLIKKLRCILYQFKYFSNLLELKELKTLYYSLVQSHLNYGIAGWGGVLNTHLRNLQIIQNRFLRIMLKREARYPTDELYTESRILDIRQLHYFNINLNQYRNRQTLTLPEHNYETRQKNILFKTPAMHKSIGQRCYQFLGPKYYNTLPAFVKTAKSIPQFRSRLKLNILATPRAEIHKLLGND